MRLFLFSIFALFALSSYAQNNPDPSVLKSQIKEIEKVTKAYMKEIEKLEKDLAKIRHETEQAKRDAENIEEMRKAKLLAFESFDYDGKKANLKAQEKELKTLSKELKKTGSAIGKNKAKTAELEASERSAEQSHTTHKAQHAEVEQQIKEAHPEGIPKEHSEETAAKIKRQKELKKNMDAAEKARKKHSGNRSKLESELAELEQAESETSTLKTAKEKEVEALREELATMNPKLVQKELENLEKEAIKAKTTYEKMQSELDIQQKVIDEKHDLLEAKKQEVREIQSVLDKL